ncbi:MAG: hypothetical protein ACO27O_00800, partial [Hylemonella sp.]
MTPRSLFTTVLTTCLGGMVGLAMAQTGTFEAGLPLRSSPKLLDNAPSSSRSSLPTYLYGEQMSGRPNQDIVLQGGAMMRRGDTTIRADRLE